MIHLLGDSHVEALRAGVELLNDAERKKIKRAVARIGLLSGAHRLLEPFHERTASGISFTQEKLSERLQRLTKGKGSFDTNDERRFIFRLGGHVVHFLRREHWRRHYVHQGTDKDYLSAAAFHAFATAHDAHVVAFFRDLKNAGVAFRVCLAPPPSVLHWDRAKAQMKCLEEFEYIVAGYRQAFVSALKAEGIDCAEPPETALKNGLLRDDLLSPKHEDAYHASPEYGAMMVRSMLKTGFLEI